MSFMKRTIFSEYVRLYFYIQVEQMYKSSRHFPDCLVVGYNKCNAFTILDGIYVKAGYFLNSKVMVTT